jgi:hypothetical protein
LLTQKIKFPFYTLCLALRAMALSKWGMILSQTGQGDPAHIWSLVQVPNGLNRQSFPSISHT